MHRSYSPLPQDGSFKLSPKFGLIRALLDAPELLSPAPGRLLKLSPKFGLIRALLDAPELLSPAPGRLLKLSPKFGLIRALLDAPEPTPELSAAQDGSLSCLIEFDIISQLDYVDATELLLPCLRTVQSSVS